MLNALRNFNPTSNAKLVLPDSDLQLQLKPTVQKSNVDVALRFLNQAKEYNPNGPDMDETERRKYELQQKLRKNSQPLFTKSDPFSKNMEPTDKLLQLQQKMETQKQLEIEELKKQDQNKYKYEMNSYKPIPIPKSKEEVKAEADKPEVEVPKQIQAEPQEIDQVLKVLQQQVKESQEQKLKTPTIPPPAKISPMKRSTQLSPRDLSKSSAFSKTALSVVDPSIRDNELLMTSTLNSSFAPGNVQNLSQMNPSRQKEILDLLGNNQTAVQTQFSPSGDLIVKISQLVNDPTGFQGKNIRSVYFTVLKADMPSNGSIKNRRSAQIDAWTIAKLAAEKLVAEQQKMSLIKSACPTRRTIHWLSKTVESIFRARIPHLKNEAANYSVKQRDKIVEVACKLQNFSQLKNSDQIFKETSRGTITKEQVSTLIARESLVKSAYNELTDTTTEKFVPMPMNEFVSHVYIRNHLGQVQRAEQFVTELKDASMRFGRVSPECRLLSLFWADEVANYQVYKNLVGITKEENAFCTSAFDQYRLNPFITQLEFEQIRKNEDQIIGPLLLIYQEIIKHQYQARIKIPQYLLDQVEKQPGCEHLAWSNDKQAVNKIPANISVQVIEFPRHKPFLGNILVALLNDFACQMKVLVPKEAYPAYLNAGWIMNELTGFSIWAENKHKEFEGDVWCVLEGFVRVWNAVLVEVEKFIAAVK
ncbi:Conserved_hypothetical protein [Hexamita inflata]|uniref:Uncharacterized protein n=1 Tax=Hexamita inflata TaxID=28002 RepID=A0AA86Q8G1_9EUKA|nr:Conserved hypothetical protein [Hexamita inflata]